LDQDQEVAIQADLEGFDTHLGPLEGEDEEQSKFHNE